MLNVLQVQNFKSWAEPGPIRLNFITGLFGTNSSGKTSILQALLLLKQTVESSDRAQVLNLGDERSPVLLGTFREVLHNGRGPLGFGVQWTLPEELRIADPARKNASWLAGREMEFATQVSDIDAGRMRVDRSTYRFSGHEFTLEKATAEDAYGLRSEGERVVLKRTKGRPWPLPAPVKCYGFPDQVKAYYQNAGFLSDLELAFEELFSRIYYLGPLREYPKREYTWAGSQPADMGQRGERVIDALLASRERGEKISRGPGFKRLTVEEYVAHWLRVLGLIHSFEVEAITEDSNLYRVWVRKNAGAERVLITDVGFGVSQILPVIALCYYVPQGSTILLEQPEIHLHPSVQAGLADIFIDAVQKRNVQIVLESHSEHLLRRLQRRIAEERFSPAEASLYFTEMEGGTSRLTNLQLDPFGNIVNWPAGFFGDEFGEMAAMTKAAMARKQRLTA